MLQKKGETGDQIQFHITLKVNFDYVYVHIVYSKTKRISATNLLKNENKNFNSHAYRVRGDYDPFIFPNMFHRGVSNLWKKSNPITIQLLSNRAKLATYMKIKMLLQK